MRYSDGTVVQFLYGDDGLDPSVVEGASGGDCPLNLEQLVEDSKAEGTIKSMLWKFACLYTNASHMHYIGKGEPRLSPEELVDFAQSLTVESFGALENSESSQKILNDVKKYLESIAKEHEKELQRLASSSAASTYICIVFKRSLKSCCRFYVTRSNRCSVWFKKIPTKCFIASNWSQTTKIQGEKVSYSKILVSCPSDRTWYCGRRNRSAKYWRTRNPNDSENFSLCWSRLDEYYAGSS